MKWLAPAKINLSLCIVGRRDDGYHELETFMVPLDLADEIEVTLAEGASDGDRANLEFICSDPTLPTGPENLAVRAAESFQARVQCVLPRTRIVLKKNIPHGAGLGGGSSDAATVLLALNELHRTGLSPGELAILAAELGSDVPFFIYRSAAICLGRGEVVEPVVFRQTLPLLLLKPSFAVPTPWAYKQWADSQELPGVRYEPQVFSWGELRNDLERPVYEKYQLLPELKTWLLAREEVAGAMMSGSGSTTFAVLRSAADAAPLAQKVIAEFGGLWTCACSTVPN